MISNILEEINEYTHTNRWRNHADILGENRWPKIAWNFKPKQEPWKCCKDDYEASTSSTF
jgi:hypothetical protein